MNDKSITEKSAQEADEPSVASPCIRVCCLDDADVCLGCFRTLDEIRNWKASSDSVRLQMLDEAARRRRAHDQRFPIPGLSSRRA